jgi:hypothetical protein
MTTPGGDRCQLGSRRRASGSVPRSLALDDLHGLRHPSVPGDGSGVQRCLRDGGDVFESTWLLLEAADRTEALAVGARIEAARAAQDEQIYLFLADRLRLLASSVPDGD